MKDQSSLLRTSLRANAIFSVICAAVLITNSDAIASLIGLGSKAFYLTLGVGLALFATRLFYLAGAKSISAINALVASISDGIWVLGSLLVIAVYHGELSDKGLVIILGVAVCVAAFGILQARGILNLFQSASEPGLYRICLRIRAEAKYTNLWDIVSNLAGIARYVKGLESSEVSDGNANKVGAIRRCRDTSGKQWREVCTTRTEGESLELKFLCEDKGFPFPMTEMLGSWHLRPMGENETSIDIIWEMKPKSQLLMVLFLPIMASKIASDFPDVVAKMEADAQRLGAGLPLEAKPSVSNRQLISGFC